jgi:hypothetical protein
MMMGSCNLSHANEVILVLDPSAQSFDVITHEGRIEGLARCGGNGVFAAMGDRGAGGCIYFTGAIFLRNFPGINW